MERLVCLQTFGVGGGLRKFTPLKFFFNFWLIKNIFLIHTLTYIRPVR